MDNFLVLPVMLQTICRVCYLNRKMQIVFCTNFNMSLENNWTSPLPSYMTINFQ